MNNKLIVTPHIIMSNNTSPISLCSRLFARPFLIRRGAGNRPRIVMNAFAIQKKKSRRFFLQVAISRDPALGSSKRHVVVIVVVRILAFFQQARLFG